jgi:hypothetical protein
MFDTKTDWPTDRRFYLRIWVELTDIHSCEVWSLFEANS